MVRALIIFLAAIAKLQGTEFAMAGCKGGCNPQR